jgi:hypothetical protein
MRKITTFLIVALSVAVTKFSYGQIDNLVPKNTIFFVKFPSFVEFQKSLSNTLINLFPKDFEAFSNSVASFFQSTLGTDIMSESNLINLGINTKEEFGFGFNDKGQPFIILTLLTNAIDERVTKLQNVLYKLEFSSFTFDKNRLIAVGKNFEYKGDETFNPETPNYNIFISQKFLDSISDIKLPKEYSNLSYTISLKVNSNIMRIEMTSPSLIEKFSQPLIKNHTYIPNPEDVSLIANFELSPKEMIDTINKLDEVSKTKVLEFLSEFTNTFKVDLTPILTNLSSPSTIFIYSYYNNLNNQIIFTAPIINEKLLELYLEKLVREKAKERDIYKFSVFDKNFYKLPINENYSINFGVIFRRLIISTDKDILISYIRNIAKDEKTWKQETLENIYTYINTRNLTSKVLRIKQENLHPFISSILPLLITSKTIKVSSKQNGKKLETQIEIEY